MQLEPHCTPGYCTRPLQGGPCNLAGALTFRSYLGSRLDRRIFPQRTYVD